MRGDERRWRPLADVLMRAFVVRLATSTSELMDHLVPIERLACVCVVNDGVRLGDVHDVLVRAGGTPERIMFVSDEDLASPAALDEILGAVRRLGAGAAHDRHTR
jgi:hypothetical protein